MFNGFWLKWALKFGALRPTPPPPEPVTRPVELYINGELVSKWGD